MRSPPGARTVFLFLEEHVDLTVPAAGFLLPSYLSPFSVVTIMYGFSDDEELEYASDSDYQAYGAVPSGSNRYVGPGCSRRWLSVLLPVS